MRVGTTDKEIRIPRSEWLYVVTATGKASATRGWPTRTHSMPSQQYLIVFAQAHEDFRVPELLSVAELYGFLLNIENDFDPSRPFGILVLEQEEHVRLLARRCILIK
jgi:hypothetical protein